MMHLEIFSSSIAQAALLQVTSVFNGVVPTLNLGFQVPSDLPRLLAVLPVSANLQRVRVQTPKIAPFPYIDLSPVNRGTAFESPARIWDFSTNPILMTPTDELDMFAIQNAVGAQVVYVGVIFTDGIRVPVPAGQMLSVHWTAAATLTAGAFTAVTPTLDQALPAGMYSLIGARVFSATGLFFQMLPAMQPLWRPGGICAQAYDQLDAYNQRGMSWATHPTAGWGEWLHFRQNVPPRINIFATAADTAEEGWLDLVYIGP